MVIPDSNTASFVNQFFEISHSKPRIITCVGSGIGKFWCEFEWVESPKTTYSKTKFDIRFSLIWNSFISLWNAKLIRLYI